MRLFTLTAGLALAITVSACKTAPKSEAPKPAAPVTSQPAPAAKVAEPLKNEVKKAKTAAASGESSLMSVVTCKSGSDERIIEVVQKDGAGCAVNYTKSGATSEIGSALNDASVCQGIVAKVRGNLETAGFACK